MRMWNEEFLKITLAVVFLFCLLEIFELALTISSINNAEKLEAEIRNSLNAIENISILLNEHLEGMQLKHLKDKRIKDIK